MGKVVRKLHIASPYQIGPYESWLSDLAGRGLFLKKTGRVFATFEKRDPANMEYRIDIAKGKFSEERKRIYEESGWEYVSSVLWAHFFRAPAEAAKTEVHTDAVEQGFTLDSLRKFLVGPVITVVLCTLLIVMVNCWKLFFRGTPHLNLIDSSGYEIFVTLCYIPTLILMIKQFIDVRALSQTLFKGKTIDHHASYAKHKRFNTILSIFAILISIFTFANIGVMIVTISDIVTAADSFKYVERTEVPFLQLRDLENLDDAYYRVDFSDDDEKAAIEAMPEGTIVFYGYGRIRKSLLAPDMRTTSESFYIIGEQSDARLDVEYYRLTFGWMAEGLMKEMMDKEVEKYQDRNENAMDLREVTIEALDQAFVASDSYSTLLFVRKGNQVMMIEYSGDRTEEELLDAIVAKIEAK